jgi:Secreted protein containing C-terminal beta-propeller domain distantly related to WD-40 repeats
LKTPGFSEYLHPVGGDKLLGVGVYERGVKIALFDVSNPTQPREVSNITVTHVSSPVLYDHHAFAYSPELRLALIPVTSWRTADYVLAVEVGDKAVLRAVLEVAADRAFFGRDAIYLVGKTQIWKYDTA